MGGIRGAFYVTCEAGDTASLLVRLTPGNSLIMYPSESGVRANARIVAGPLAQYEICNSRKRCGFVEIDELSVTVTAPETFCEPELVQMDCQLIRSVEASTE